MEWAPLYPGQEQAELPWDACARFLRNRLALEGAQQLSKNQLVFCWVLEGFGRPLAAVSTLWRVLAGRNTESVPAVCLGMCLWLCQLLQARLASLWVWRENSTRPHLISARVPYGHLDSKGKPDPARELEADTNILCCEKSSVPPCRELPCLVWGTGWGTLAQGLNHQARGELGLDDLQWPQLCSF